MPTQAAISAHLDLDQGEVSRLMKKRSIDWKTASMDQIRLAYIHHIRGVASGHRADSGADLMEVRVQNEQLDVELKTLNLAEKKGVLVNVGQLEAELMQMVGAFRTELLSRDDKLKGELDALYGIDVDAQVLNEHTHAALRHFARYDPGVLGVGASAGGRDRAAGENLDDGMGAPVPTAVSQGNGAAGGIQP